MDIKKLIGETTEYDKKQSVEIRRPKSWLKSVSAFANGDGGYLFLELLTTVLLLVCLMLKKMPKP